MTNAVHLVVRKRVLHTAQSMKEASTDTAFVVREMRRTRCVVRLQRAERTRCAGHRAAAYDAMSCYCWYSGNLARYRVFWAGLSGCPRVVRITNKFLERVWVRFGLREKWVWFKRGACQAISTSLKYVILNRALLNRDPYCTVPYIISTLATKTTVRK